MRAVTGDVTTLETDALIVNLFEGVTQPGGATGAVDRALGGAITRLIAQGEIKGKKGELTLIHTLDKMPAARVIVAGLGTSAGISPEVVRQVAGGAARLVRRLGVKNAATIAHGAGIGGMDPATSAQAIAEGTLLGLYTFHRHKSPSEDQRELEVLHLVEQDGGKVAPLQEGLARGALVAQGAILARDLVNEPANVLTPTRLAEAALQAGQEVSLEVSIFDRPQMEELGMGALLAVAQGSQEPPRFIIMRYSGDPDNPSNNLALLGKGITFDSGGISIKPAAGMGAMKGDMGGGAAVIGAMRTIGMLKPRINVMGLVPSTENMPSGSAQRPGDVVRAMSGKTIEVENTDAEGRMALADAMCYARQMGQTRLVDVATLTGAARVALGTVATAVMGNHQDLVEQVLKAGDASGEKMWQLPLFDEYKEQNRSDVADLKNSGGQPAGAITAALFIGEFSEGTPWAHLDIAGTARSEKDSGYVVKGATGVPVRTLVNLVLALAESGG